MAKPPKRPSDRIIEKYLDRINERKVNEIVITLMETELNECGYRPSRAKILIEAQWKKYDNSYGIRLDMRPDHMGGPQLHIKNRSGTEWAYRGNGTRSEKSRFTTPSTRAVRDIVRTKFSLEPDVQIESQVIGFSKDETQLLIEVRLAK